MNIEYMKELVDNSEAIFTDVFDTIIYRKNYPDYNKKIWCQSIKEYFELKMSLQKLIELREKTEIKLRQKNQENGYDFEFNYNEFAEEFYNQLNIDYKKEAFLDKIKEIEIDIEFKSQELFSDSLEIIKYAYSQKKDIYCISDMYLTKKMMSEIFKRHNIAQYFKDLIISSEELYNKSSKKLFETVKTKYKKYNYEKCLMMGDNYWYDCKNAIDSGYNGIFVDRGPLFANYNTIKEDINNKKYIYKLYSLKDFYEEFDEELYLYNELKKLNIIFYKKNMDIISYSEDTEDLIKRIKIINGEEYFSKKVTFSMTNNKPMIYIKNNKYIVEIDNINYEINKIQDNLECFVEITKCLNNKVGYEEELNKVSKEKKYKKKKLIMDLEVPEEELHKLGKYYTPLFDDFISWIYQNVKKENISKIYFFTREGEFYKKLFDKINKSNIKSQILEVSRVATFFPSFKNTNIKEMKRLWSQYSKQSISAMFKSLNINIYKYLDIIYKHNLSTTYEILNPIENVKLNNLFNDDKFIKMLEEDLKNAKDNILGYFKNKDLANINEKIAIVDIGWRGTIQDNICYILENTQIYGYYFGLEEFLNKQPKNSKKFGYINQYYGHEKILGDVTPFEMLCNSCNGSTLGYEIDGNNYRAIRKIDNIENESYEKCTKYIQESIINNIGKIKYKDDKPFEVVTELIYNPNPYLAKIYFNLKHNEEFGLGEFVSKKAKIDKKTIFKGIFDFENGEILKHELEKTTWPHGYLVNNKLYKYKDKMPLKRINEFDKIKTKKRIAWIMPDLLEGSGGHRTIIQNANYLVKRGYQCDLYFNEDYVSRSKDIEERIKEYFGECLCQVYIGLRLRVKYDMIFATYSVLTPEIVKNSNCKNKMYFIQDFEPWFDSMGDGFINKEMSYTYGFRSICIGNWLKWKLQKEYDATISSFPFCADLKVYHPIKMPKENAICFIFQPDKPRRCVELGLKALKIVKAIKPDIKIYLYGSKWDYYVDFEHENLKIINIEKCNELYNKCKVGLCISSSNPSRIPFEMMAAGLPVVDVYRENNLFDMPDEGVTLAYSTPQSIASSILTLLEDEKLAKEKSKYGIEYMKNYDLETGFKMFADTIDNIFNEEDKFEKEVQQIYNKKPIEIRTDVKNFSFILDYRPVYHETTDYIRNIIKKKRTFKSKLKSNGITYKFLRKGYYIIRNIIKR